MSDDLDWIGARGRRQASHAAQQVDGALEDVLFKLQKRKRITKAEVRAAAIEEHGRHNCRHVTAQTSKETMMLYDGGDTLRNRNYG